MNEVLEEIRLVKREAKPRKRTQAFNPAASWAKVWNFELAKIVLEKLCRYDRATAADAVATVVV